MLKDHPAAHADQVVEPAWEVAFLFPAQGEWSEHEYLELDTNHLVEFSHGQIEVLPMPSDRHQAIVGFLFVIFCAWLSKSTEPCGLRHYVCSSGLEKLASQIWFS